MKENTVILPKIVNLNSSPPRDFNSILQHPSNDQFNSDLNSVDMYLVNKKCSTKYDIPQLNDLSIKNSMNKDSPIKDSSSRDSLLKESFKRGYHIAFDSKFDDISAKRRNNLLNNSFFNSNSNSHSPISDCNVNSPSCSPNLFGLSHDQDLIDKITLISTTNVKKIMDLLNKSTSIRDFQTQLHSLILNLCADMHNSNGQEIENLRKRVNYLTDEKMLLTNIIKSQYESLKKLKMDESNSAKTEEEKLALKSELNKFKTFVNNFVYTNDSDGKLDHYFDRKPPDVY